MKRDELSARLRATFATEVEDQVRVANTHLLALEATPDDAEALRALFRVMHTLKGAARAAGVPELESLCQELETLLAELRDEPRQASPEDIARLFAGLDRLEAGGRALRQGLAAPAGEVAAAPPGAAPEGPAPGAPAPGAPAPGAAVPPKAPGAEAPPAPAAPEAEAPVRVAAARVDALVSSSSRLTIAAARTETQPSALWEIHERLTEAAAELHQRALRGRREVAAADRALWRKLGSAADAIDRLAREAESSGRELRALTGHVSAGVRELRMRPFADAVEMLPRLVRDLAAATGKDVRLELQGEAVEADRAVLAEVHEALLHLVRNAVDHGIEPPEERRRRGKPPRGTVRVTADLLSDRLLVTVEDDGAGVDTAALKAALARQGQSVPEDARDLARALFGAGISTRRGSGAISGRGVGLDAVRAAMQRVRGSVDVSWTEGAGTRFILDAPLTLAGIRAVIASLTDHLVAVPSAFVQRLLRLRPADLGEVEGREAVLTADGPVPLATLAGVLGPPFTAAATGGLVRALLLRVGERRAALVVDELLTEEELLVRPITAHGGKEIPHLTGAALLPSGRVALVLNARTVVLAALRPGAARPLTAAPAAEAPRHRILVVDDSLTTRALEQSLLEAAGYDVVTAVDGADAWALLQERGADLVVSDVEMPRMDGLALCEAIRGSPRFRKLPVVLVTALETAEQRDRGLEVGADAYLTKSSFDQEILLETIQQLLG